MLIDQLHFQPSHLKAILASIDGTWYNGQKIPQT